MENDFECNYKCNKDPLEQIYPSQNMCVLLDSIPRSLRDLPYGMYTNCDIYYTNRFSYNKRWNWFPHAIFTPSTVEEIHHVFGQFLHHKLPFFVRSGGHCYEQVIPKGYILDLRNFNYIRPDPETGTVVFGAGCRLGNVIQTLGAIDYAIPTGTCPSVGLAGLSLGGGSIGFLQRTFGLTSDSIISMEVITADNKRITVTEKTHPDLFWALRGAGNNTYGIVYEFTFKMYHIPKVSTIQLSWDFDRKVFSEVFHTWQQWVTTLPSSISAETVFKYKANRVYMNVNALKVGREPFTEWEAVFKPLHPDRINTYHGNYVGAAELFASNYTFPFSKAKSKFIFKPLEQGGLDVIMNWLATLKNNHCEVEAFWGIEAGNPGAIVKTKSAYFPRNAFGSMIGFIYWPHESQSEELVHSINQTYRELEPFTSPYSYSNLVDYDLGPDYLHAYYGDHVPRLIRIKNKWDPKDVFHWRQGIPLGFPC